MQSPRKTCSVCGSANNTMDGARPMGIRDRISGRKVKCWPFHCAECLKLSVTFSGSDPAAVQRVVDRSSEFLKDWDRTDSPTERRS
jgi:hypothetical protein